MVLNHGYICLSGTIKVSNLVAARAQVMPYPLAAAIQAITSAAFRSGGKTG